MPLVRVEVRNEYRHGTPEIYKEANKEEPKEILEGVAVAGLIGVLRQLGDLIDFAAEIFHGLQAEVTMTSSRSSKLLGRVRRIEAAFSPVEKAMTAQRSHLHLAYVHGSNWHARIDCEKNKFVYTDVPQFLLNSYENCSEPPPLHLLDRFDPGGPGSCFKRYSDPSFFKKASAQKGLEDKKETKIKKLRSWPRNGGGSQGASYSNPGCSMPLCLMSRHDATLRSYSCARSDLNSRNFPGYSKGDFRRSYSMQPLGKRDDYRTHMESFSTKLDLEAPGGNAVNFEALDKTGFQTSDQDLQNSEYIDICFDEFENEKEIFLDAPNAIELEDETDINCTRSQGSKLECEAAEFMKQNWLSQTSYSERNASLIVGGCKHNPISVSLKSSFAAFCCVSCISAKDLCNSVSPLYKSLLSGSIDSYSNVGITDGTKAENATCAASSDVRDKRSGLAQKPALETSNTLVSFWSDGGLGYDLGKQDYTESFRNIEGGLNTNSSAHQEYESSFSFRKIRCKISLADLGLKLHKNDASQDGSLFPVASKNHAQDSHGTSRKSEQGNRLLTSKQNDSEYQTLSGQTEDLFGCELSISSPSSSPPLRQMKMSFQPIDGIKASKLKPKFPRGTTNDESCRDIFPSFQLVPEVSMQRNGGSDSGDDTSYRSSASSLDGCHSHQSELNSEQWESGESPTNKDSDLGNFLSRISCSESASTVMDNWRTSHVNNGYMQSSHSCCSFNHQSLNAINHSFQDDKGHDNLVELEFASIPDPSSIPPVQWHDIKRNLDYAVNLNDSLSTISQQPKPAPFDHDNANELEQTRKQFISQDSNGQRESSKGKNIDEKEDFLQLIRSKSFNLRPTLPTKTVTPSASPTNVHVTAILKKADSIRQAVGSDAAEDDEDWSDI